MSWDLTAIKTKRHVQSVSDLTEEDCVPLEHQQMITELEKAAKACDAQLDTRDPSWLVMEKKEWLIEFSLSMASNSSRWGCASGVVGSQRRYLRILSNSLACGW